MKLLHFGNTYNRRTIVVSPTYSNDATYGYAMWSNDLDKWSFTTDLRSAFSLDEIFNVDAVYALNEYNYETYYDCPEMMDIINGSIL